MGEYFLHFSKTIGLDVKEDDFLMISREVGRIV